MDLVSWNVYTYELTPLPTHRQNLLKSTADQHNNLITLLDQLELHLETMETAVAAYHSLVHDLHVLTEKTPPCSLAVKALLLEKKISSIYQSLKNSSQIGKAEPQSNTPCPTLVTTSESFCSPDTSPESSNSTSEPTRTIPRYSNTTQKEPSPTSPPSEPGIIGEGWKKLVTESPSTVVPHSELEECGRCRGYGTIGGVTCSFCGGQGYWHVSS